MIFSYDPDPVCFWVSGSTVKKVYCGLDERLCGDTIFQAEYKDGTYVIRDLFLFNSCNVTCVPKEQRTAKIAGLMQFVYTLPGLDEIKQSSGTRIVKSELPDVYFLDGTEDYVQVPDIETSEFLRSLGDSFDLLLEERDGLWFVKNPCLK